MSDFASRHLGPRPDERLRMLEKIGASSIEALIDQTVPADIRLDRPLDLPPAQTEREFLEALAVTAGENRQDRTFIGMGYYGCVTPGVIQREMLENPGWYTPYTPYQAEVAQGRLEALLIFQTMVADLTAMEVANASLLDEATAAAEAMTMLSRIQSRQAGSSPRSVFLVSSRCFPQTLAVVRGRAEPLGIEVRLLEWADLDTEDDASPLRDPQVFGCLVQSPDGTGAVHDLHDVISRAHAAGVLVAVACDLLGLTLLTPPGEMGADVVVGSSQRFGVPPGYGGPHAAFLATRLAYVRQMPGRLIGVSKDTHGSRALRMALQTREQHIRREKATSNICTSQALLANIAAMYAVYHGPDGLTAIARRIRRLAGAVERAAAVCGYAQENAQYVDTLVLKPPATTGTDRVRAAAEAAHVNLRYFEDGRVGIALDETCGAADVRLLAELLAGAADRAPAEAVRAAGEDREPPALPDALARQSAVLSHPVFNAHHSEIEMMRYLHRLDRRDIGLDRSMIPLGSCTMKLTAATEMFPVTWPEFASLHPFVPLDQARGYARVIRALHDALAEITGLPAVSLQPNSGAQGEFTGLMVIRAYHRAQGRADRTVVLIPASAHGTNPASATAAGMQVVVVDSAADGSVDVRDLETKARAHADRLAALMITYPSTHGVFEAPVRRICEIVHAHGGQVYMDGANMNAQVGLASPGRIGVDVCHLNLHKTFAIPHGGGGPGMGPIAVAAHLAPFLPGHPVVPTGGGQAIPAVSAAPWGSANVLVVSHAYIRLLGGAGLAAASQQAILSANYLKARLESHYPVLYAGLQGRVAHELILDLREFRSVGIEERDVAKRLIDYGFHAPTVSFPVHGTLMIEPTESEPLDELDRFCEAMIQIRREIQDVVEGRADRVDNVLKNAPHTAAHVSADTWTHAYSRAEAAYPLPWVREDKYWAPVGRVDDAYGDRHLQCGLPGL